MSQALHCPVAFKGVDIGPEMPWGGILFLPSTVCVTRGKLLNFFCTSFSRLQEWAQ